MVARELVCGTLLADDERQFIFPQNSDEGKKKNLSGKRNIKVMDGMFRCEK